MKLVITSRKLSLEQGNIFTPVCHSVHRGGLVRGVLSGGVPGPRGVCYGGSAPGGVPGGDLPRMGTAEGGTHPTGMHSCVSVNL